MKPACISAYGGCFLNFGSNMVLTHIGQRVAVAMSTELNVEPVTASGAIKGTSRKFSAQLNGGSELIQGCLQANSATITNAVAAGCVSAGNT